MTCASKYRGSEWLVAVGVLKIKAVISDGDQKMSTSKQPWNVKNVAVISLDHPFQNVIVPTLKKPTCNK